MNKEITIIDLLNKIANGEEVPKKIMFLGSTYRYDEIDKTYRNIIGNTNIGEMHNLEFYLNDKVEIIEDNKRIINIEKLQKDLNNDEIEYDRAIILLADYINISYQKLIDKVNKLKEEK